MSDPLLQPPETPDEYERLALARAQLGDLPEGVEVSLGFLSPDDQLRHMHENESAAFLPPAEFAETPDGIPVVRVDFAPVAHALRTYPVEVTQHGVTNALAGVPTPVSLYARFRIDGRWEFPIHVTLENGPEGIVDRVIDQGVFLVFGELGPDAPYVRFERMHRFDRPTVVPPTVGRNDPCPCGSGKKMKRCHGA